MNGDNDHQIDDDFDYRDYLDSIEHTPESNPSPEPLPDVPQGRKPIGSRYVARGRGAGRRAAGKGDTVEDYKHILVELEKKIEEICSDKATTSEPVVAFTPTNHKQA